MKKKRKAQDWTLKEELEDSKCLLKCTTKGIDRALKSGKRPKWLHLLEPLREWFEDESDRQALLEHRKELKKGPIKFIPWEEVCAELARGLKAEKKRKAR